MRSEGTTAHTDEPGNDDRLVGVPDIPAGAEPVAVVTVVLYVNPDGTENAICAAVNADGDDLPLLTSLGLLRLAERRLLDKGDR